MLRSLIAPGPRAPRGVLVVAAALAGLASPAPGAAGHGEPRPLSVPELVLELESRLDALAEDFGFEPGAPPGFAEPRFGELLLRARVSLEEAGGQVERGEVCEGLFKLARSVSQLEHAAAWGAAHDVPDSHRAGDLAAHAALVAESFLEALIVIATRQGVPQDALELAIESEAAGEALRLDGEWTAALVEIVAGTCSLL